MTWFPDTNLGILDYLEIPYGSTKIQVESIPVVDNTTTVIDSNQVSDSLDSESTEDEQPLYADFYTAKNAALIARLARIHFAETERVMALARANDLQGRFRRWLFKK
jgi:hypothetical protein